MKVLVLGAGGMAGHIVTMRLMELGHGVTGLARRNLPFCETIVTDVAEADLARITSRFDAVINCIGLLNTAVDAAPHLGIWLNAYLPHLLAAHARRVIHLSTDCVFSGRGEGGYTERDFRDADTLYGRTKALGELDDGQNLTFRTSIVGPDINANGIGLFNWFMGQNGTVSGYTGAVWSGVTTLTLADAIHAALEQNLTGVYHLVNGKVINKFELLKEFNTLRDEPVVIAPSDAVRENKSLLNTRADFNFTVPSYEEMVRDMGKWIGSHSGLYRQNNVFGG